MREERKLDTRLNQYMHKLSCGLTDHFFVAELGYNSNYDKAFQVPVFSIDISQNKQKLGKV